MSVVNEEESLEGTTTHQLDKIDDLLKNFKNDQQ
jgi:hypothetical protein